MIEDTAKGLAILTAWAIATWLIGYVALILANIRLIIENGILVAVQDAIEDVIFYGWPFPLFCGALIEAIVVVGWVIGRFLV